MHSISLYGLKLALLRGVGAKALATDHRDTTTELLAMRDDILRAMQRGEVTMAVLADYFKAFDTVAFETVLRKLLGLGFSTANFRLIVSYLTDRKQFVQIDEKTSKHIDVTFGVPQDSILTPILFNLYVNDISDCLSSIKSYQYADDTTIYLQKKPTILKDGEKRLQQALNDLATWSADCNLCLKVSSSYNSLSLIRKLKRFAPLNFRKQLAESLVFSKLYYNNIVYITTFLITFLITSFAAYFVSRL